MNKQKLTTIRAVLAIVTWSRLLTIMGGFGLFIGYRELFAKVWPIIPAVFIFSWIATRYRYSIQNQVITIACRGRGWRLHSPSERASTRRQGYIGLGEDELFASLQSIGLCAAHQVEIHDYYTADMVCLSPWSGRITVVEVDGRQHHENRDQVMRDRDRMNELSAQGISTIRFQNFKAKRQSKTCAKEVKRFLGRG